MVSGNEQVVYVVYNRFNFIHCSRYEEFVRMSEKHVGELSGMVRLMVGFFVSQLFRRWWWQFEVRKYL